MMSPLSQGMFGNPAGDEASRADGVHARPAHRRRWQSSTQEPPRRDRLDNIRTSLLGQAFAVRIPGCRRRPGSAASHGETRREGGVHRRLGRPHRAGGLVAAGHDELERAIVLAEHFGQCLASGRRYLRRTLARAECFICHLAHAAACRCFGSVGNDLSVSAAIQPEAGGDETKRLAPKRKRHFLSRLVSPSTDLIER